MQWCLNDALIYEEREEEVEEEVKPEDVEVGIGIFDRQIRDGEGDGYRDPDVPKGPNHDAKKED